MEVLITCYQTSELARIELFVFLTFLLLLCMHLVSRLRRCCRSTVLKVFDLVANAAILALIPYIFSMMSNLGHTNDLISVWAVYLLYVYVNVPNFVSFNDSLSIGLAYVKICHYGYYIFLIYTRHVGEVLKFCSIIRLRGLPRLQAVIGGFTVLRALEILFARACLVDDGAVRLRVKDHHGNISCRSVPTSSNGDPWLRCNYVIPGSFFFLTKFRVSHILSMHIARFVRITWIDVSTVEQYDNKVMRSGFWIGDLPTWMVVIASAAVELVQLIEFWFSRWQVMLRLCDYFAEDQWKKQNVFDRGMTKVTEKALSRAARQNVFVRPGRRESKSVSLTSEIKEAVIKTLLDRGPQLTNGIATLKASNKLSPETKTKLFSASTQVHTKAQLVLIWHIATSLCELKQGGSPPDGGDFNVATSLSKYCAYLVAFAPDLLPDIVASTNYTCNVAIREACSCLKSCEASMIYDKLMEIAVKDDDSSTSILKQGAVLGKVLVEEVVNQDERWEVLASFWVELILYLAPNDHNEWAHVARLADGGEFITHLWALLFHTGFVDRDSLSNHPARDADANHPSELGQV